MALTINSKEAWSEAAVPYVRLPTDEVAYVKRNGDAHRKEREDDLLDGRIARPLDQSFCGHQGKVIRRRLTKTSVGLPLIRRPLKFNF